MLKIRGLVKSYGDLLAVAGIDLEAKPGEILALLGPNGAGKTTTIKCLVGLLQPDAGEIVVAGHDVHKRPMQARQAISYAPEVARLYDALTPEEYLTLKGRLFDLEEAVLPSLIDRLLSGFELSARRREAMLGFSKGMTQKVSIAAALLTDPKLLVLDEPLSGLDVETTMVVKEVLRQFAAAGGTVLYCSHLLDVVESLADRVAVIDKGKLIAQGSLAELRGQAGAKADARLEALFQKLTESTDPVRRAQQILGKGTS